MLDDEAFRLLSTLLKKCPSLPQAVLKRPFFHRLPGFPYFFLQRLHAEPLT